MRKKRPVVTSLDQVKITREGDSAIIEYNDPTFATTSLGIGKRIKEMTDQDILDLYNDVLRAQQKLSDAYNHIAVEIPEGSPQITHHKSADQWTPRGQVLRCIISDGGPDGEAIICIDEHELSLREFGRLLCTYAGWGMRIIFVPEDEVSREPAFVVWEPEDDS